MCTVNPYHAASPNRACGSHQPCKARRGIQAFATLCCHPPAISPPFSRGHCYFSLSSMSLCHLPERHHHPSHQKTLRFSRCLWAGPAAPLNHLLPQTIQINLPNIIISICRVAVLPSIPQPAFSRCPFCFL